MLRADSSMLGGVPPRNADRRQSDRDFASADRKRMSMSPRSPGLTVGSQRIRPHDDELDALRLECVEHVCVVDVDVETRHGKNAAARLQFADSVDSRAPQSLRKARGGSRFSGRLTDHLVEALPSASRRAAQSALPRPLSRSVTTERHASSHPKPTPARADRVSGTHRLAYGSVTIVTASRS
jgi:hypothetical protein